MTIKDMISPEDVKVLGLEKSEENLEFRKFLKINADEDELDNQFKMLHNKFFRNYDCTKCRNCCEVLRPIFNEDEINHIAKYLNISKEEFINRYLEDENGEYIIKNNPCDFLGVKGCQIYNIRPCTCKNYPYTNKKNRLRSLWAIISNAEICPVVYEILEELKEIYNFEK